MQDNQIDIEKLIMVSDKLESEGKTAMLLAVDGLGAGVIAVADTVKAI